MVNHPLLLIRLFDSSGDASTVVDYWPVDCWLKINRL